MVEARWLDHAPDAWRELLAADPGASPSHRPELCSALADALPGLQTAFLAIEADGRLVGGVSVSFERRASLEWLHALPMLLPSPPLALAGHEAEVDALAIEALAARAAERCIVGGEWSWYRPGRAGPARELTALGEVRWLEAACLSLEHDGEALLARMDRKSRQALRQTLASGLHFAEDPGALEPAYQLHLGQGRLWSTHRALPLELARRLLHSGGESPVARLFTLRDARGLLSATLALDGPHEAFLWWSGTHAHGRRAGAFPALVWHVCEWARARGRRRVNLGASTGLGSVASFKQTLGAQIERYPIVWLDVRHGSLQARLVAALQRHLRRGRAQGEAHA